MASTARGKGDARPLGGKGEGSSFLLREARSVSAGANDTDKRAVEQAQSGSHGVGSHGSQERLKAHRPPPNGGKRTTWNYFEADCANGCWAYDWYYDNCNLGNEDTNAASMCTTYCGSSYAGGTVYCTDEYE